MRPKKCTHRTNELNINIGKGFLSLPKAAEKIKQPTHTWPSNQEEKKNRLLRTLRSVHIDVEPTAETKQIKKKESNRINWNIMFIVLCEFTVINSFEHKS